MPPEPTMQINIIKSTRGPEKRLAEAELVFDARDGILWDGYAGVLDGVKLAGFEIWTGSKGLFVKCPGRRYEQNGEQKQFDFVRLSNDRAQGPKKFEPLDNLKKYILDVYQQVTNG